MENYRRERERESDNAENKSEEMELRRDERSEGKVGGAEWRGEMKSRGKEERRGMKYGE